MNTWGWAILGSVGLALAAFIWRVLGDMAADEIRGWIEKAPFLILRLAALQLNREQRQSLYYEAWRPELIAIVRDTESLPITRAIRGLKFALGLLIAARTISRLSRTPPAKAITSGGAGANDVPQPPYPDGPYRAETVNAQDWIRLAAEFTSSGRDRALGERRATGGDALPSTGRTDDRPGPEEYWG